MHNPRDQQRWRAAAVVPVLLSEVGLAPIRPAHVLSSVVVTVAIERKLPERILHPLDQVSAERERDRAMTTTWMTKLRLLVFTEGNTTCIGSKIWLICTFALVGTWSVILVRHSSDPPRHNYPPGGHAYTGTTPVICFPYVC